MKKQFTLLNASIRVMGRRFRVAAYLGDAPGSHMGFWRSDAYGLKGWNYRIGRLDRCFTLLAHMRRT